MKVLRLLEQCYCHGNRSSQPKRGESVSRVVGLKVPNRVSGAFSTPVAIVPDLPEQPGCAAIIAPSIVVVRHLVPWHRIDHITDRT